MAAVGALANSHPQTRLTLLAPLLADDARIVRMDAARALSGEPERHLNSEDRTRFEAALDEFVAGQRFNAERPEAQVNLANLHIMRGKVSEAEAALLKAIEIDPTFVPAPITLAELRRSQGQESAAEATLRSAIKRNPESAPLLHALGLSLVRQKRTEEAVDNLIKAAKLAPEAPRFAYVAGIALHDTGKLREASEMLEAALSEHPYDREILYAVITYEGQAGQLESALSRASLLHELEPENQQVDQLIATLRQSIGRGR
jgi:tetratricopeptide (TPR) repeat protein